jgi:hypothetical protein
MTVHPHEPTPITEASPTTETTPITKAKRERPGIALPATLLAIAMMLGLGITAFSGGRWSPNTETVTVGQSR